MAPSVLLLLAVSLLSSTDLPHRRIKQRAAVHGIVSRSASVALLRSRKSLGAFNCHHLVSRSSTREVVSGCWALRKRDRFSILQLREEGSSMYVCCPVNDTCHRILAIMSTENGTSIDALKAAVKWHADNFPNVTLTH